MTDSEFNRISTFIEGRILKMFDSFEKCILGDERKDLKHSLKIIEVRRSDLEFEFKIGSYHFLLKGEIRPFLKEGYLKFYEFGINQTKFNRDLIEIPELRIIIYDSYDEGSIRFIQKKMVPGSYTDSTSINKIELFGGHFLNQLFIYLMGKEHKEGKVPVES